MVEKDKEKKALENFSDMFIQFGSAIAEIFSDPDLKKKARDFGKAAADSAKYFGSRLQDEEVKEKFKKAAGAAYEFGKQMEEKGVEAGKKGYEVTRKVSKIGKKVGREIGRGVKGTIDNIRKD